MARYKKTAPQATPDDGPVVQTLNALILGHLSKLLPELVEQEISESLGRTRYEHHEAKAGKQYRNGHHKPRALACGCGSFSFQLPRLREPFDSQIVKRYQRHTDEVAAVLPQLYLHGLSTGDFRDALQALLGEHAPLSPASIVRLKQDWEQEYKAWKERPLQADYLYVWTDGVYPKAGPKAENMAVLVVVGLNRKGEKEILAIEEGYRESEETWRDIFRNLKQRGVRWIGLTIADGLDGLRQAARDVFPLAKHQRCFVHKMRNVLDKIPNELHDEVQKALQKIYNAGSRAEALGLKQAFVASYGQKYPKAVKSLNEAGDLLFSYFDFPEPHWKSIKSTNVIESMFAAVKLRTDAARRIRTRESALYLVFKLLTTQEQRLHKIRGYRRVAETIDALKHSQHLKSRNAA